MVAGANGGDDGVGASSWMRDASCRDRAATSAARSLSPKFSSGTASNQALLVDERNVVVRRDFILVRGVLRRCGYERWRVVEEETGTGRGMDDGIVHANADAFGT